MSPVVRNGRGERSEFAVELRGSPQAPVTRRVATDAERDGFAQPRAGPGLIRLPRHLPPTPIPVTPVTPVTPEEPVMAESFRPPFPSTPIDELVSATEWLRQALDRVEGTGEQLRELEGRIDAARQAFRDADDDSAAAYARLDAAYAALDRPRPELSVAERRHERLTNGEAAEDASESSTDIPQTIPGPAPDPTSKPAAAFAAFARDRAAEAAGDVIKGITVDGLRKVAGDPAGPRRGGRQTWTDDQVDRTVTAAGDDLRLAASALGLASVESLRTRIGRIRTAL